MVNKKIQLLQVRSKKLGILLYDARLAAQKSVDECARALNIPTHQYLLYESGEASPTLPEIEAFAFFCNIPVNHFFGQTIISDKSFHHNGKTSELAQIRNRMISIQLRIARAEANLTIPELSEKTSISEDRISSYESGEPVPLSELSVLTEAMDKDAFDLIDQKGPIGMWIKEKYSFQKFCELSEEIQQFISKPINLPYLELALKLSKMPAEELRQIAENILQITF